jgi:hypothetical protein
MPGTRRRDNAEGIKKRLIEDEELMKVEGCKLFSGKYFC